MEPMFGTLTVFFPFLLMIFFTDVCYYLHTVLLDNKAILKLVKF